VESTGSPGGFDDRTRDERQLLESVPLFSSLTPDELDVVHARCSRLRVGAGEWFIREGDPSDALYVVIHGRLQAFGGGALGREMSRGHVVGEIGTLSSQPRTAGVRAVRDSELLALPLEEFDRLAELHPAWLRRVAEIVIDRLVAQEPHSEAERVLTLGIFAADDSGLAAEITDGLHGALSTHAPTVKRSAEDAPSLEERARWAHGLESTHRYVLYDATAHSEGWHRWCLNQSDRVILVADARRPPVDLPRFFVDELTQRVQSGTFTLVLVHPAATLRPSGVTRWLEATGHPPHLHLRRGNSADLARAARLLTGRGSGLVLGGGGPRGFAHLGVMKALDEAHVPIDAVGGTSIGAVMGALRAMDLDHDARQELAIKGLVNSGSLFAPTLPLLSFSSAQRVRRLLEDPGYFGTLEIEECWLPYFCVSANLTRAETVIHDRGPLAKSVRASLSLPGIFPPVRHGADLLVDGGVLNNLPIDVMRDRLGGGSVIAVNLAVTVEVGAPDGYQETPSGWSLLSDRLRNRSRSPLALGVLMRARDLAGIQAQRSLLAANEPDLMIHPDVAGYKMFDFKAAQRLVDVGYRHTVAQLEAGAWTPDAG
jgi:NTE family protein